MAPKAAGSNPVSHPIFRARKGGLTVGRFIAVIALALVGTLVSTALPSIAADGLAWDQVMKFSMDGSIPEPNFAQDFQAASQPAPQEPQHGGMFGGMMPSMGAAMGAMQMFRTGIAERHYVAGNLERVDNVAQQTATITDCNARTITYLNLAKKTYRVVSMDQPQGPPSAGGQPERRPPAMRDDDTRFKLAYTSQSLGPKQIDGAGTDGYQVAMAVTIVRPNAEAQTMNMNLTQYFSSYAQPQETCHPPHGGGMGPPSGAGPMAAMGNNAEMTRMINEAMRTPGGDPRFTLTSSGPPLPKGRLDLFSVYQFGGGQQSGGRGFATILERGNVRPISGSDQTIFGVPSDFTKEG